MTAPILMLQRSIQVLQGARWKVSMTETDSPDGSRSLADRADPGSFADGWRGSERLPGYRAGAVVVQLDDLPAVDAEHLYLDVMLLDDNGACLDHHSGTCAALGHGSRPVDRMRFVRVVAELVRHVPLDTRGLAPIGQALRLIRERGVEAAGLAIAAQLIDKFCDEDVIVASLMQALVLSLGSDEAPRRMRHVVTRLARESGFGELDDGVLATTQSAGDGARQRLNAQVLYVVRTVSKVRARHYLREMTECTLIPTPDLLGV
jgi:hypothetical protein